MKFIADFHIHSHYSIATSKKLIPEYLDYWARIKGINIVGTGDCVHPGWYNELQEKLEPAENGLYRLKKEYRLTNSSVSSSQNTPEDVFFILTGEISSIYKKKDKVRKVHNLCVFPNFNAVLNLQKRLMEIGNIKSDGRPILGLDSKILLEMVLESSKNSYLIPAHIWTPWFSVLGSKSGFDNIEECYEDLTQHIFAVETGLSSDPPMNWACSFLDRFKLVSNSDAHSPEKLGREANLFDTEPTYDGIYNALSGDKGFLGTVEFFPQEGKYHYDGHRKCNICWDPLETLRHNGICPVCGKPITKGVMYRIAELADRSNIKEAANKNEFYSITSLPDVLAELLGKRSATKTVQNEYFRLIENIGSEFYVLLNSEIDEIRRYGGELLGEAIKRLRNGNVIIDEGYDGEYGRIKVFNKEEVSSFTGASLFSAPDGKNASKNEKSKLSIKFDIDKFQSLLSNPVPEVIDKDNSVTSHEISDEQQEGIEHLHGPCIVLAGPGAGKTRILTERIIHLISNKDINPENILAVTFSNKAASEMRERVKMKIPSLNVNISTFHAFGLSILKEHYNNFDMPEHFYIADNEERKEIMGNITGGKRGLEKRIREVEAIKQGIAAEELPDFFNAYNKELQTRGAFDLNDLICLPVWLFNEYPGILDEYRKRYPWILVDEYQDINARQYELIMMLGSDNPNLFVIGDPDQSIYGFRGSDVRFIDKIKTDLPGIKTIALKNSYRCPSPILRVGGQVLQKNKYLDGLPENRKIHIHETGTDKSEADWIAAQIERMMGGVRSFSIDSGISDGETSHDAVSFSDFSVLCRTMAMFDPIIKAFEDHGIAYQVIGTEPFYEKEPVRSLIDRFRKAYFAMINANPPLQPGALDEIQRMVYDKKKINNILEQIMEDIDISPEDRKRLEMLSESYNNDYEKFFLNISTRRGIDDYDINSEAVSLMTLHASKGLEFNSVFIPGCEEGIIPFELFGKKSKDELEEEERLFYVGITRTQKHLFLSHAKKRFFKGRTLNQRRSPLLDRVEKQLLQQEKRAPMKNASNEIQLDLF